MPRSCPERAAPDEQARRTISFDIGASRIGGFDEDEK